MKKNIKSKTYGGNTGRILEHLKSKGSITSIEAFEKFGATRLSAVVFNLRKDGFAIKSEKMNGQNRFGEKVNFVRYELKKR